MKTVFKRMVFCCIILGTETEFTSDQAHLVSLGLQGLFTGIFEYGLSAALLLFEVGVICSAAGGARFVLAGSAASGVPTGSMTQQTIADVQGKVE